MSNSKTIHIKASLPLRITIGAAAGPNPEVKTEVVVAKPKGKVDNRSFEKATVFVLITLVLLVTAVAIGKFLDIAFFKHKKHNHWYYLLWVVAAGMLYAAGLVVMLCCYPPLYSKCIAKKNENEVPTAV